MTHVRFEWDDQKNCANQRKHHVSFEEAASAFADEQGLLIGDPDHLDDEDRDILPGLSSELRLLVVVRCF